MSGKTSYGQFDADSVLPKRKVKLTSAEINALGRLQVVINSEKLEFPSIYLKRCCQCSSCFNPHCKSFISSLKDIFRSPSTLQSVSATENGVNCIFSDGHTGEFSADWLYNRRMTGEGQKERDSALSLHHTVPWCKPEEFVVQKATWTEVTETESGLSKFASYLIRDGIFVISDAPTDRTIHDEFGEKTGILPIANHYGYNWIVENLAKPENQAYTNAELGLHVDQTYLSRTPCVQLLHCMAQSEEGGENVMSDGIKAAIMLRERHPEDYQLLTTLNIQQEDVISHKEQKQCYTAAESPIIAVDAKGEPMVIKLNHISGSTFFQGTADEYEKHSKALKKFYDILYELSITIKSQPGDILSFDNQRVLHGRLAYDTKYKRKLEGFYVDWDMIHSRFRVSQIRQSLKKHDLLLHFQLPFVDAYL